MQLLLDCRRTAQIFWYSVSTHRGGEGFGAILMKCKKLSRLHTSGLLTDQALCYIGQYGKSLRTLCVGVAGKNEMGLKFVLDGCPNLLKLEMSDFQFGDSALRSLLHHFYRLQFVKISACGVTHQCCEYRIHWEDPYGPKYVQIF
ncbi:unnamed protein product [Cuscuta epithymum]|uniref:Uncharacterized protein n=1 Tax=Cuscuta epithymum TaxID=186058 RepID=A0AAV0FLH6_9ASTE|nr:unnamed protein product [Cuscuta epithymum]